MNNLPKGFYYNEQGALVNSKPKKTTLEKKVEKLENEINLLKEQVKCLLEISQP